MVIMPSNPSPRARFFSLKWKAFISIGLLLAVVFIGFIIFSTTYLRQQFEFSRDRLVQIHVQQLETLSQLSVTRMRQLLTGVGTGTTLRMAISSDGIDQFEEALTELFWSIQLETSINGLAIYSDQGQVLVTLGEPIEAASLIEQARQDEHPHSRMTCGLEVCRQVLVMPVLVTDRVFFLAASAAVTDIIIQFANMTGIDLAALFPKDYRATDSERRLSGWQRSVAAVTNLERNLPLLKKVSQQHSLEEMLASPLVLYKNGQTKELRTLSWKGMELVFIEDISAAANRIRDAILNGLLYGLAALILAELLLLWLLWGPTTRLRQITSYLPLLAENHFQEVQSHLAGRRKRRRAKDETDVLQATAKRLGHQLEAMRGQLQRHNQELAARGAELKSERDFVQQLLNTIPAMVMVLDRTGRITLVNLHGAEMTGYAQPELENASIELLIRDEGWHANFRPRLEDLLEERVHSLQHEADVTCWDGRVLHMSWHYALILNPLSQESSVLAVGIDITARKEAERRMTWLASHDALTGLYNRRSFTAELERVFQDARRTGRTSALVFFDLDQFKDVNDTSGHQVGDQLLKRIASNLMEIARGDDFVARLDGDEFAVIAKDINPDQLPVLAERFSRALAQVHVEGRGHSHRCTASIGIVIIPWHGDTVEDLVANADLAMYRAKEAGRNQWQMFDPKEDTTERVRERVYWNEKVTEVLKTSEFQIHFQPILSLKNNKISHYEALLRVYDGDGQVATGLFIQAAERNGAIHVLDERILERVMQHQAELVGRGVRASVAVNLSGASFQHPERLMGHIKGLLERYQVPPELLIFELTETAAVKDINATRQLIIQLRELGFQFALDDFGVGFSSLFYLKQLPVDFVKIDGSFIRNLCQEPDDQALVQALVQVARVFRLKTVAEFVESQAIVDMLHDFDVDYAQGYNIGKPCSFEQTFPPQA